MTDSVYDKHSAFYLEFIDRVLADENDFRHQLLAQFENTLRDRIQASVVCDVACGEGYLARFLVQLGAKHVIGIASATELIATAQERANNAHMIFRVDDAQTLETIADETIDIVVSQLASMDIPDHRGGPFCLPWVKDTMASLHSLCFIHVLKALFKHRLSHNSFVTIQGQ